MNSLGRLSGVLLPVFSLRSKTDAGIGDFGALDGLFAWMQRAQQRLLMVLPLLPTAAGDPSPYSTRSAFGLNPMFIDLTQLDGLQFTPDEQQVLEQARAAPSVRYDLVFPLKTAALGRAFEKFLSQPDSTQAKECARWCDDQAQWLDGFTLYSTLGELFDHRPFWEWPEPLAKREPAALQQARTQHARRIRYHAWLQWVAETQWDRVRAQARARGVLLCGDEPFIIGQDSADAWCFPQYLRREGRLGVPPDDFSADGQDWGLPWFDFDALARDGDRWLKFRARKAASTYDLRRVDHAIGYFRQYIRDEKTPKGRFLPADEPSQIALGTKNFKLLSQGAGIVAEDLGVIPPFARKVLDALQLPGYQVMRWAREEGVYRNPHEYPEVSLVTTGTHDTETLREWWEASPQWERDVVCRTFPELQPLFPPGAGFSPQVHEALLAAAENASSRLCVIPWQDVFAEKERINLPASMGPHNWTYRMKAPVEELLTRDDTVASAEFLARLTRAGRRA